MRNLVTIFSLATIFASEALAADPAPTNLAQGTATATSPPSEGAPAATTTARFSGVGAPALRGPTLWGMIPWGGIGVGGRFMIPLGIGPVLNGSSVRDSFALELGADLLHFSDSVGAGAYSYSWSWNELLPVGGIMWNIWLNDRFALYPKVELGYALAWVSGSSGTYGSGYGGVFFSGAGGALYKMDSGLTLRAELGIAGLKVGAGWLF